MIVTALSLVDRPRPPQTYREALFHDTWQLVDRVVRLNNRRIGFWVGSALYDLAPDDQVETRLSARRVISYRIHTQPAGRAALAGWEYSHDHADWRQIETVQIRADAVVVTRPDGSVEHLPRYGYAVWVRAVEEPYPTEETKK